MIKIKIVNFVMMRKGIMKKMMVLISSMICCTCLFGMDVFKKKPKGPSQASQEEGSAEASGQNSPKASPNNSPARQNSTAMTSSAGSPKKTISNMQQLRAHHVALKQSGGLSQSGEVSSKK
jgi:hypothetical protein